MSFADVHKVGKHGAAESIRMLLEMGGERLGKLRTYVEHWLNEGEQTGLLDVQHTIAVARSIGAAAGLITGDHWIDAQIDTVAFVMYELLKKTDAWFVETDEAKRAAMKKELLSEIVHYYFNRFENSVKANGGHFSMNFSWVDVFFFGVVEVLEMYFGVVLVDGKFPFLMKLIEEVGSIPEIQTYIEKRRNKAMEQV